MALLVCLNPSLSCCSAAIKGAPPQNMVLLILDMPSYDVPMIACVCIPESQSSLKFTSQPTPSDTSSF